MSRKISRNKFLNKIKGMSFFKKNLLLVCCCLFLMIFVTIGYAALTASLNIAGDLVIRAVKDIRITNISSYNVTNSEDLFNPKFTANTITISNSPTGTTGTRGFKVTIKNSGTIDMTISNIVFTPSNENLYYSISDNVGTGTVIKAGETLEITVYLNGQEGSALIEFEWSEVENIIANAPDLLNNSLVPIKYNGSNWVIISSSDNWYNYSNQEWANAAILSSSASSSVGTVLDLSKDVEAMYVWIPRYEYKIDGTYGNNGTASNPGEITVKFIDSSQTAPDTGYVIHSAFWWDTNGNNIREEGEELNGIWVAKFESSGNSYVTDAEMNADGSSWTSYLTYNKLQNLPGKSSSLYLYSNKDIVNSINNNPVNSKLSGDSLPHMMNNSEWGAVAYLSQSTFGKYGNSAYTGANKEIYVNNTSTTGKSSGQTVASTSSSTSTCNYDDLTDRGNGTGSCGGGASTTGNITGVYDMSGTSERVMAYYSGADISLNLFTGSYNTYGATISSACDGKPCYGHALSETLGWYSDKSITSLTTSNPWVIRGGKYSDGTGAGIFAFSSATDTSGYGSFRSVLISRDYGSNEIDTDNLVDKVICDSYSFSAGTKCYVGSYFSTGSEMLTRANFYVLRDDSTTGRIVFISEDTFTTTSATPGNAGNYRTIFDGSNINSLGLMTYFETFSYTHRPHLYVTGDVSGPGVVAANPLVETDITENNIKFRLPYLTELVGNSWLLSNGTDKIMTSDVYQWTYSVYSSDGSLLASGGAAEYGGYDATSTSNGLTYYGSSDFKFKVVIEMDKYNVLYSKCNTKKECCCPTGTTCECMYKK